MCMHKTGRTQLKIFTIFRQEDTSALAGFLAYTAGGFVGVN